MTPLRVDLRCNAAGPIGVGHLARCVALAEECLARGHRVTLVGRFEGDVARRLVAESGADVAASVSTAADVVHVDSYDEVGRYDARLLSRMHDGAFGVGPADLVVDPTPGADHRRAPPGLPGDALRLAGARYLPLRDRVVEAARLAGAGQARGARPVVTVVVGGTDPLGLRALLLAALAATGRDLDIRGPGPTLLEDLSMSDLVVTAAGTTLWETCHIGAPAAAVRAVENQAPGYAAALAAGSAVGLGGPGEVADVAATAATLSGLLSDPSRRAALSLAGAALVDGLGAWRVVSAWEYLLDAGPAYLAHPYPAHPLLTVRPATTADADLLFAWRNDEVTRAFSRTGEPVLYADHRAWLTGSLGRHDRVLLVAADDGGPLGTVRWDEVIAGEWEVSLTVAPRRRGAGLAGPMLVAAEGFLRAARSVTAHLAWVRDDNAASRRLFARAGYLPDLPADSRGFARYLRPTLSDR